MKKRQRIVMALIAITVVVFLGSLASPVQATSPQGQGRAAQLPAPAAQSYSFAVPELLMDVTVQPDGSTRIVYNITLVNYGSPIDIIDIGTPNDDYALSEMKATINGQPLSDIRTSTYIDTGVEIHFGKYEIGSGEQGTLYLEFVSPNMVYADTTNEENASLQITPTWFDSDMIQGTGDIEIHVRMLPDIASDEVLYQDEPFTNKVTDDRGTVRVIWRFEDVRLTQEYRVGVSFPQRGLTQVIEITFWDLLGRWLGNVLPVLFGCLPVIIPIFFVFLVIRGIIKASKPNYLPPIAQTEGGGIKRGLTAPEAAAILELPLTKILGLVIFGMLEKGLIRQTEHDPLTVEVVEDFRVNDKPQLQDEGSQQKYRRRVAQQNGTVIHQYEHAFLDLIEKSPEQPVKKLAVVKPMQRLVNSVAAKMKGFDLSDTQDYYRRVIDRAMEQAASLGDIEQREAYLDKYLPWVMMRKDYRPALSVGGYHYWPMWARQAHASSSTVSSGKSGGSHGGSGSTTTFGDVSASFSGWAETTMGGMAAAILPTSLSKPSAATSSSRSSGGSSCACACAGCACACACAGGGR